MKIPDDRSTNEAVLDREHMRIFLWICDADVCQLNVKILIHTVQRSRDAKKRIIAILIAGFYKRL